MKCMDHGPVSLGSKGRCQGGVGGGVGLERRWRPVGSVLMWCEAAVPRAKFLEARLCAARIRRWSGRHSCCCPYTLLHNISGDCDIFSLPPNGQGCRTGSEGRARADGQTGDSGRPNKKKRKSRPLRQSAHRVPAALLCPRRLQWEPSLSCPSGKPNDRPSSGTPYAGVFGMATPYTLCVLTCSMAHHVSCGSKSRIRGVYLAIYSNSFVIYPGGTHPE